MRTRRRERGGKALRKTVEEARVRGLNGVQLAFVGDTIYDLYARTQVLEEYDACVRELHRRAVAHVNARAQARAFAAVEPLLSEEEADVARRGRNAHSRPPKNQDPGDYARATALEALVGYLYLLGRHSRLEELFAAIRRTEEEPPCRK